MSFGKGEIFHSSTDWKSDASLKILWFGLGKKKIIIKVEKSITYKCTRTAASLVVLNVYEEDSRGVVKKKNYETHIKGEYINSRNLILHKHLQIYM